MIKLDTPMKLFWGITAVFMLVAYQAEKGQT